MPKSYYTIAGTNFLLNTPKQEINSFFDYTLKEFIIDFEVSSYVIISVVESIKFLRLFTIYKEGEIAFNAGKSLKNLSYYALTKALENVIAGHAINELEKKEMMAFHAGAVSKEDNGILMLGESGYGKSTLTIELVANHNWLYLTDEVGLLDVHNIIHPFLKTISCKNKGIVKTSNDWITKQFEEYDYQVAVPRERYSPPVYLKAIIFVKYSPNSKLNITKIKKSDALQWLLKAQIGRAKYVATIEQMAEVVKKADAFLLHHNDCTKAAELIDNLIGAS